MRINGSRHAIAAYALGLLVLGTGQAAHAKASNEKIPITTSSEEARQLFVNGRDLSEKLRATDARKLYEQAVAKDANFAMGYVGLANTAPTGKDFFEAVRHAVARADKVSEGERLVIQGLEAQAKGEPARQKDILTKLVKAYPNDERAHTLLGVFYFGQQDYPAAIASLKKAATINPEFSAPLNQLGYAYRFVEKYKESEQTFKKYIDLIPNDPNPYDSYAELLMRTGRFEESIKSYEKALSIDPNFVASYVGIGNDQIFMGKTEDARRSFAKLASIARNDGEKRTAHFWSAISYVYDGDTKKALAEIEKNAQIAETAKDLGTLAGDFNFMANLLLEAGHPDQALVKFKAQLETSDKADLPAEVKEAIHRNFLFNEGLVALAQNDLGKAKANAKEYAAKVAVKKVPFQIRQTHELAGRIALAEKQYAAAAKELAQANRQDPRVLYLLGTAYKGSGDSKKAHELFTKTAEWNSLAPNLAYVRSKAKEVLSRK